MTTKQEKLASIAHWDSFLRRHPQSTSTRFLFQLAVLLGSNGMTLYLLVNRRMQPVDLVVLVALEALLLTALAWMQWSKLPASAKKKSPESEKSSPGAKLGTVAFGLLWLAVIYGAALSLVQDDVSVSMRSILESGLQWPLALCLLGALIDSYRDWEHWTDHGGEFCSTPGLNAAARWLTLFLGGIPFLVPMIVIAKAVLWFHERPRTRRAGDAPNMGVVLPLAVGVFGVMLWVLNNGVSGWAVGFISAKVASELFIVCMPLIATKARAEEVAGLGKRHR